MDNIANDVILSDVKDLNNAIPVVTSSPFHDRTMIIVTPDQQQTEYTDGQPLTFKINTGDFVNFNNSYIEARLVCASNNVLEKAIAPFNTIGFIDMLQVDVGNAKAVELIEHYNRLKTRQVSCVNESNINDIVTLQMYAFDRTKLFENNHDVTQYENNPDYVDIQIPFDFCLKNGHDIPLYHIPNGILLKFTLAQSKDVLTSSGPNATQLKYWIHNPRIRLQTISANSSNVLSEEPYVIKSHSYQYTQTTYTGDIVNFNFETSLFNQSVKNVFMTTTHVDKMFTLDEFKLRDAYSDISPQQVNYQTKFNSREYPSEGYTENFPTLWKNLKEYFKEYDSSMLIDGRNFTSHDYYSGQSDPTFSNLRSNRMSIFPLSLETFPESNSMIDGVSGIGGKYNISFKISNPPEDHHLFEFWFCYDMKITITADGTIEVQK